MSGIPKTRCRQKTPSPKRRRLLLSLLHRRRDRPLLLVRLRVFRGARFQPPPPRPSKRRLQHSAPRLSVSKQLRFSSGPWRRLWLGTYPLPPRPLRGLLVRLRRVRRQVQEASRPGPRADLRQPRQHVKLLPRPRPDLGRR